LRAETAGSPARTLTLSSRLKSSPFWRCARDSVELHSRHTTLFNSLRRPLNSGAGLSALGSASRMGASEGIGESAANNCPAVNADVLSRAVRQADTAGRIGGEECGASAAGLQRRCPFGHSQTHSDRLSEGCAFREWATGQRNRECRRGDCARARIQFSRNHRKCGQRPVPRQGHGAQSRNAGRAILLILRLSSGLLSYWLALERTAMRRTIIGNDGAIDVEHIADMLRSLALPQVNRRNVNWWSKAEKEIEDAKKEAAENGGSIASAEQIFLRIFERAIGERRTATRKGLSR